MKSDPASHLGISYKRREATQAKILFLKKQNPQRDGLEGLVS
jgi:hypothetical protein